MHRAKLVRNSLNKSDTVTDAIYDAGFNSNSRFTVGECTLGSMLVAQRDRGICAIFLGDDPDSLVRDLQDQFPKANLIGRDAHFEHLVAKVVGFVEAPARGLDLPLDVRAGLLSSNVSGNRWRKPRVGSTVSYANIANLIGSQKPVRAVAQACGANVLAVAIPRPRVVRNDGALSGYRWCVERKRALLETEAH